VVPAGGGSSPAPVEDPPQSPAVEARAEPVADSLDPVSPPTADADVEHAPASGAPGSPLDVLATIEPQIEDEDLEFERERATQEPASFDIPIVANEAVLAWVELYSGRMREAFAAGLTRAGRYEPMFRRIFREAGLPQDLVYMAHVESGYKTSAYSRAHAKGIFQFIVGTGRRYGLRVDYWVDERADPEKSARAAAAYMTDLYAEFRDWHLALAAYNAGEGKVRQALARSGSSDFWGLARSRYLRRETKNHVPAILAAAVLSKQPEKYGFSVVPDPPLEYDTLAVDGAADLRVIARCAGSDLETLRQLNPALRRLQTPPDGRSDVRVPAGTGAMAAAALAEIPQRERVLYARHVVRSGDTLSSIARAHGVSVRAIQDANHMGSRTLIRVSDVVLVPTSSASQLTLASTLEARPESEGRGEVVFHAVRAGETLSSLARQYATTPAAIAAASGIALEATLHVGDRLRIVRGVADAAVAALRVDHRPAAERGAAESGEPRVHMVRRGDTLWRIASLYNTSVGVLCALNQLLPGSTLHPGTRLTVGFE